MKQLYINNNYYIQIDPDTNHIDHPINFSYSVKSMYAIQEPTSVTYSCGETEYHETADKGDVVCVLYHKNFKKDLIVIKNEELYNNLIDRFIRDQQEKEDWAESNKVKKDEEDN